MRGKLRLLNRMNLTTIAIIALMLLATAPTFLVYAASATLSVVPASIIDLTKTAGKSFYVNVTITGAVNNTLGYQFTLSYNTFVLTATNYTAFLPFTNQIGVEINDRVGYVAASYDISPPAGFNGTTALLKIGFIVDYLGQSDLDLRDTRVWNLAGGSVAHTATDGYFRNVDLAKIPTASFTRSPSSPLQGQNITFDASASTANGGSITKYSWIMGDDVQLLPNGNGTKTAWTNGYREWDDPLDVAHDADNTVVSAPFMLNVFKPNANGLYTAWTQVGAGSGHYDMWNDWPANDADLTMLTANANNLNETSQLDNHGTQSWTIGKVRLTIAARSNETTDERVRLMLVIGSKGYNGSIYSLTTSYSNYSSEWSINPATGLAWTWADIDALQAGVRSQKVGATWTSLLYVTQLFVAVLPADIRESSTLEDPLSIVRTHNISTVRVNIVARTFAAPVANEEPNARLMLIIGGTAYFATTAQSLTADYMTYSREWSTNPATSLAWTWSNIDSLEAGVSLEQINGQGNQIISITRLYVTVVRKPFDLTNPVTNYYYRLRGNYTVNLGVYDSEGTVGLMQATINVRGHDVAITKLNHGGYRALRPVADSINFTSWAGNYTAWDDWPTPDYDSTVVTSRPTIALKPNGAGSYNNWTMVNLIPDGDGAYIDWTGTYANWDDWPGYDTGTLVTVNLNNKNESSTLSNAPSTVSGYSINRVRLTIVAKYLATSDEKIRLMLVIGGKGYNGSLHSLTTAFAMYTYDWTVNPATNSTWTWADINSTQAGVRSQQTGASWTSTLQITQLYVSVSTSGDYTAWNDWEFNDADASIVSATTNNLYETSTMENHGTQNWPIERVRVNFISRTPQGNSQDEKLVPILVIGGTVYAGSGTRPSLSYPSVDPDYSEWLKNPATGLPWTWAQVDALEAGFKSVQTGTIWNGELRVTQMWIGVYANTETSAMADYTTETWDIQNVTIKAWARSNMTTNDEVVLILTSPNYWAGSILEMVSIRSNTTWAEYTYTYDANPWQAAGTPWTWDDLNDLEVGVRQNPVGPEWTGEFYVTQLYIEVFGYYPPGNFDLVGTPPKWTEITVSPQETVRFLATVENQGNFNESNVNVTLYANSTALSTRTISRLGNATYGSNSTITFEFAWVVDGLYDGTYLMSVRTSTISGEYDTADNNVSTHVYGGMTRNTRVIVRVAHDVAVTAVNPAFTLAFKGYNRKLQVTVKNQGSRDETTTVRMYYNSTLIGSQAVTLTPGQVKLVNFTWTTGTVSKGFYMLKANTTVVTGEIGPPDNTGDNSMNFGMVFVTTPGDCNGDKAVNILDVGKINANWWPTPPLPDAAHRNVDINDDGAVNILDKGIVNAYWGQPW